jgi:hypothetical protein
MASDRRLKTNITEIGHALEKLRKLRGIYYDWIQNHPSGMVFDDKRHVGLFAQDVQAVLPEAVSPIGKNGEYLGVNYSDLVPLLVEAMHELEAKIIELELEAADADADAAAVASPEARAGNGDSSSSSDDLCESLLEVVRALQQRVQALEADNARLIQQLQLPLGKTV